jgi:hypothetical protein
MTDLTVEEHTARFAVRGSGQKRPAEARANFDITSMNDCEGFPSVVKRQCAGV